ncbi:MAG TPA: ATP-binding protein [Gemmatimonadales bacterium]|nr:ATP-binding protein [Gemmatimonadales bacterium]
MRTLSPRRSFLRPTWPLIVVLAELALAGSAWAAQRQKQVLVVYSTRRDAQIAIVGDRRIPQILEEGLREGLDYHSEYIDQGRFPDPQYRDALRDFLRLKYRGEPFGVVIAMGDLSLEFVEAARHDLFPDAPVVFFAGSPVTPRPANSTGVVARTDLGGTVALASALQPDLQRVFVVNGSDTSDRLSEQLAREQFRQFEPRLTFAYLTGLPTEELERRVAALPARSIVYYLVVNRDGAGQNFHPLEYIDRLSKVTSAPIYSWVDSAMDHGIVGGSLKDQEAQTVVVAQLALQVLRGARADDIPVSSPDLHVPQVDWRQLRRWGISQARVPAGTLVRFQELSVWDRYKVYILVALAALVAQTGLITGLLVQRARRQRAEQEVRGGQAALQTSYERIRDLGGRLLKAQETERSRIARELHDDISQQMALLQIDLELLGGAAQGHAGELAGEALNRAQGVARSVHDLSHRLHPAKLRLIGLVSALHGLQRELSRTDIAISFTHDNVPTSLPADLTLCLFRVAQEALQNALKYSGAKRVLVHLRGVPGGLALTVADDGVGFDVGASWNKGLGLVSMGERLEAIGGTFDIHSTPGAGTRLEASVPLGVSQDTEIAAV